MDPGGLLRSIAARLGVGKSTANSIRRACNLMHLSRLTGQEVKFLSTTKPCLCRVITYDDACTAAQAAWMLYLCSWSTAFGKLVRQALKEGIFGFKTSKKKHHLACMDSQGRSARVWREISATDWRRVMLHDMVRRGACTLHRVNIQDLGIDRSKLINIEKMIRLIMNFDVKVWCIKNMKWAGRRMWRRN